MASTEYVKWLLLNPNKIDSAKERYPYFARFLRKYIMEKYSRWFEEVEKSRCPFCGTEFNNPYTLRLHLSRTKCNIAFENIVRSILYEWDKFEVICGKIKYRKSKDVKQTLLKLLDDDSVKLEDIYRFCRENS
jgi:hypothetical protein